MPGPSNRGWVLALLLPLLLPVLTVAVLAWGHDPVEYEAGRPMIHREDDFIGSATCRSCHLDQHASWKRTYHRTMTQRPTTDAVVGLFDGRTLSYEGQSARVFRDDEHFYFEVPDGEGRRVAEVALAVGSHRYQQYFEREQHDEGWTFRRLPFLWHIGERRWLAMNSVFLGPDNPDWNKTRTRWNDNCVFCHNTGARPGETFEVSSSGARQFDSEVAELGISCETCHGPGREHAELHRDPVVRYASLSGTREDDTIVDPNELTPELEVDICGQCHGQRVPNSRGHLVEWLTTGPTYRSGERLSDHVTPIARTTPSPTERIPDLFRLRFWEDGTPRLSAYEYQGVKMSPCHIDGELKCGSCHTMHGGDPKGMIEPVMRGNAACTGCHEKIAVDLRAHTGHDPAGSGSECMECHMPRMVYGILEVHRSHRIENPDPARDAETGRPNACTLCHLDKSPLWAAEESRKIWGAEYLDPIGRLDKAPLDLPDSIASLFAGDAVQRVVYAAAAGRRDAPLEPGQKEELRLALAVTTGDAYPSVRWTARRSLLALEEQWDTGLGAVLADWDTTNGSIRGDVARDLLERIAAGAGGPEHQGSTLLLPDGSINMERILALLDLQSEHVIDIGE